MGCRQFKCKLCERWWMLLRRKFTNHRGSAAAKARAKAAMNQKLYKFKATNPKVTALLMERYPHIALSIPAVVT